jgi:hypothetical protein
MGRFRSGPKTGEFLPCWQYATTASRSLGEETGVPKFYAGLCQMWEGRLAPPYEAATIEKASVAEAVEAAKIWAQTVDRRDAAWLVIQFEGRTVARFNPDEF